MIKKRLLSKLFPKIKKNQDLRDLLLLQNILQIYYKLLILININIYVYFIKIIHCI